MRTRKLVFAGIVAGALALSACASNESSTPDGGDSSAAPTGPMVIQSLQALSGPVAPVGEAMSQGNKAAMAVINAEGGVLGQPLQIEFTDSGGSSDTIAAKLQQILADGKPPAVLPGTAAEIPAAVPILAEAGVFTSHHFTTSTLAGPPNYPLTFSNAFTAESYWKALAEKFKELGYAKIGLMLPDDATAPLSKEVFDSFAADNGLTPSYVQIPTDSVDATPQLEQLLSSDPDVLVLAGYSPSAAGIIKAIATNDVKIPIYSAVTFSANNLASLAPAESYKGITFQQLAYAVKGNPKTETDTFKRFYDAVKKEAGGSLPFPMNTYLVSYNDVILAATAANLAGSFDPQKMTEAIQNATPADMPDYVFPVNFSATVHQPQFGAEDYDYVPYGPTVDGLVVPGGS